MIRNHHGGRVYDKLINLDFSVNINPLGMPKEVKQSIVDNVDSYDIYPDTECLQLRRKLSQVENVDFENIVCGNGADDIIFRISQTINPKRVLILSPTFSEYEKSLNGCEIKYYPLKEDFNFKIQPDILDYISNIDIFYLCNPNNPTGQIIDESLMDLIVHKCRLENVILLVDECFLDFVINGISFKKYLNSELNMIILKAFTKIYCMAGIRLGYALCSNSNLCDKISNQGQAWSVSTVAQVCGLSALGCIGYIQKTRDYIQNERQFLVRNLNRLGLKTYPSEANYILIKSKLDLYNLLLEQKILIRDCSNYIGLDSSYFRVAIRKHEENQTLIDTLNRILKR